MHRSELELLTDADLEARMDHADPMEASAAFLEQLRRTGEKDDGHESLRRTEAGIDETAYLESSVRALVKHSLNGDLGCIQELLKLQNSTAKPSTRRQVAELVGAEDWEKILRLLERLARSGNARAARMWRTVERSHRALED